MSVNHYNDANEVLDDDIPDEIDRIQTKLDADERLISWEADFVNMYRSEFAFIDEFHDDRLPESEMLYSSGPI